jgi:hypothetical protein
MLLPCPGCPRPCGVSGVRRLERTMAPVTHVANVVWPAPGLCFRMVYSGHNGYPTRCPTAPRWSGTFVNPRGARWPVAACDEHVGDVHRPRPIRHA